VTGSFRRAATVQRSLASLLFVRGWCARLCSRIMRAKHGWHMRRAAFTAALRIMLPHHAHTTSEPLPAPRAPASPVYEVISPLPEGRAARGHVEIP
jgi:hypothetical protein